MNNEFSPTEDTPVSKCTSEEGLNVTAQAQDVTPTAESASVSKSHEHMPYKNMDGSDVQAGGFGFRLFQSLDYDGRGRHISVKVCAVCFSLYTDTPATCSYSPSHHLADTGKMVKEPSTSPEA